MKATKITKKEFISLLTSKESALIGAYFSGHELHTKTSEAIETFKPDFCKWNLEKSQKYRQMR